MPSSKRERQRAQRQVKVAHVERRRRTRRRARQIVVTLIAAGAIVGVIILVSGGSTPKKAASTTTSTTTTSTSTSTTAPVSHTAVAPTCPPPTPHGAPKRVIAFTKQPPICIQRGVRYEATVVTDVGRFVLDLLPNAQLRAVNNFVFLARYHFFNGITFHRVVTGFVVQGGDPTGTGSGGPGYQWTGNTPPATCSAKSDCYAPFDVAYASSGSTKTNGSQFFIILPGGQTKLSPLYTLFGKVVSGTSVVERIGRDGSSSSTGVPLHVHHMISVTITQSAG